MTTDKQIHFLFSYLRRSVFICGSFFLLFVSGTEAFAQGGKAEPNRIKFKRGAYSTIISGTVRGDEEAEYIFSALQGQRILIQITSVPRKSCLIELHGPERIDLAFSEYNFNADAPVTGDYRLIVLRPTESTGRSRYRMKLTVK